MMTCLHHWEVQMRLDRAMSDLLVRLQPRYKKFRDIKGCIVVLLNRELWRVQHYGARTCATLWQA
jgi:hypothetical protein